VEVALDVARLEVIVVAGHATPHFARCLAAREDGHTVVRFLAVPDGAVARGRDLRGGESRIAGLDFLEARDVGLRLFQPFQQPRQAAIDPVHVAPKALRIYGGGSPGERHSKSGNVQRQHGRGLSARFRCILDCPVG
jgi:hypothetical protein